jgi:hypothetical protein
MLSVSLVLQVYMTFFRMCHRCYLLKDEWLSFFDLFCLLQLAAGEKLQQQLQQQHLPLAVSLMIL